MWIFCFFSFIFFFKSNIHLYKNKTKKLFFPSRLAPSFWTKCLKSSLIHWTATSRDFYETASINNPSDFFIQSWFSKWRHEILTGFADFLPAGRTKIYISSVELTGSLASFSDSHLNFLYIKKKEKTIAYLTRLTPYQNLFLYFEKKRENTVNPDGVSVHVVVESIMLQFNFCPFISLRCPFQPNS